MPHLSARRQKLISDLNVTNFIDVILTVLIIFMITAPMMTRDEKEKEPPVKEVEELKVELPTAALAAGKSKAQEPISLGIDASGGFHYGPAQISRAVLLKQLHEIALVEKGRHIRVEVDRRAPSAFLVELLDIFAYEGISDYGIHTLMQSYGTIPNAAGQSRQGGLIDGNTKALMEKY